MQFYENHLSRSAFRSPPAVEWTWVVLRVGEVLSILTSITTEPLIVELDERQLSARPTYPTTRSALCVVSSLSAQHWQRPALRTFSVVEHRSSDSSAPMADQLPPPRFTAPLKQMRGTPIQIGSLPGRDRYYTVVCPVHRAASPSRTLGSFAGGRYCVLPLKNVYKMEPCADPLCV